MASNLFILSTALVIVNLVAFVWVGIDKNRSVQNSERVPEVYLFFAAIFFSALGVLLGMYYFHHKTHKVYFPLGIGLLCIQQTMLLFLIILLRNLLFYSEQNNYNISQ